MDDLRQALVSVAASLQVLAANTKANTQDLERLARRSKDTEEAVQQLRGTFASIERHLVILYEKDSEMRTWRDRIEARVEALERRTPPAA